MITFLDGILDEKQPGRVVMNIGGVGYEVLVPLSSFDRLPAAGETTRLLIYHHITDVSQALFGFATDEERQMFKLLLSVSGIGPKIAVSALSGMSVRELKASIFDADIKRISSISGIGKKTAERVIVELRDKCPSTETLAFGDDDLNLSDTRQGDAAMALVSLGYKQDDARKMIKKIKLTANATVESLIRNALTGK